MKNSNTTEEFSAYPLLNQLFILFWLQGKDRPTTGVMTFDEWRELADALGLVKKNTSIERIRNDEQSMFFDNVLDLGEMIVAWDGPYPIDSLTYKVNEKLKQRINQQLVAQENR